jgi:hypothetical protein
MTIRFVDAYDVAVGYAVSSIVKKACQVPFRRTRFFFPDSGLSDLVFFVRIPLISPGTVRWFRANSMLTDRATSGWFDGKPSFWRKAQDG